MLMSWGGVLVGWSYCVCVVLCLLSLLFASTPKGASAHVMQAALFLLVCPLASCLVLVQCCALVRLCAMCARACLCCGCGGLGPVLFYGSSAASWLRQPGWLSCTPPLYLCCLPWPPKSAANDVLQRGLTVRQPIGESVKGWMIFETRLDGAESLGRNHDQRISFQESP